MAGTLMEEAVPMAAGTRTFMRRVSKGADILSEALAKEAVMSFPHVRTPGARAADE